MKRKALLISVIAAVMVLCTVAGATLAYLFVKSEKVENTFTPTDITLELKETTGNTYQMIPGVELDKNPKVTASASEGVAYYVYVKIEETADFATYMEYSVASTWAPLVDENNDGIADNGVYYKAMAAGEKLEGVSVLTGDKVTVKSDVTKTMMNALTSNPKLTITAYAIQQAGFDDAVAAWPYAFAQSNNP